MLGSGCERHRAPHSIQILRVEVISEERCKRPNTTQWHAKNIRFPKLYKRKIDTSKKLIQYRIPRLREF